MPLIDTAGLQKEYDVIVVGSGAAGGQTAYTLTLDGAKVLMLEAGRNYVPEARDADVSYAGPGAIAWRFDARQGVRLLRRHRRWWLANSRRALFERVDDEPIEKFWWWRARMLGGRTNHWGRISLRNGPYDFKPKSRDGLGFDWPISYEDVAPYYDKVEMLVGVYGENNGLENTPDSPAGCLLPAPKPRAAEALIQKHAKKTGVPVIADSSRRADTAARFQAQRRPTSSRQPSRADRSSRTACAVAHHVSGRHPAAGAARSRPTINRRQCTCRPPWRAAISIFFPTPWCAKSRWRRTVAPPA